MTTRTAIYRRTLPGAVTALAICALLLPAALLAQDKFPSKPITVVIHAKYGGGTDTTARLMMIRARRVLGVDMQVIAKRGGSGAKAHQFAANRPRDGYTILALTQSHLYTIARGKSVLSIDDVVGIARAMDDPTFIVVSGKSGIKSIKDLVAQSRRKPLNWGVAQIGGTEHIGLVQFAKAAGIQVKVVPFGSGAQMVHALLSGAIDATLPNVSEANQQVQDGTFRALAVMAENIAFKPYACGTMAQPFIDCAIRLGARGVTAEQIRAIECNVGEGTVHRLWEPAVEKHAPSTAYSAKFSVPYCIAVGVLDGAAGLAQFTEERVADPAVRALAAKVGYRIDPANEYPANYSGHLRTTLENGEVIEIEQPHLRGGRREPLSQAELEAKFFANAAHGGWQEARARKLMDWCGEAFTAPTLAGLAAAGR